MNYVRIVVEYCAGLGLEATVATSTQTLRSDEFQLRFHAANTKTIDLGELHDIRQPGYLSWLVRVLESIRNGDPHAQILVLEGDKLLPRLLFLRLARSRFTVLVMRVPRLIGNGLPSFGELFKRAFAQALRMTGVNVIGLAPAQGAKSTYRYNGLPAAPDPIEFAASNANVETYRSSVGMGSRYFWFGVFGNIDARKNVDLLAVALAACASGRDVGLLLAGSVAPAELSRIESSLEVLKASGASIVLDNRLLPDHELDAAVAAVDAVAVLHSTDGPSGILGKAAAAGKFLLAGGPRSLSDDIARLGAVGTFVTLDRDGVKAGVLAALQPVVSGSVGAVPAGAEEFARMLVES